MYKVEVTVSPIRPGEKVDVVLTTEEYKNSFWNSKESADFVVDGNAERILLLEDNERLVVAAKSNVELVYDKEQNAAVPKLKEELSPLQVEVKPPKLDPLRNYTDPATRADTASSAKKETSVVKPEGLPFSIPSSERTSGMRDSKQVKE